MFRPPEPSGPSEQGLEDFQQARREQELGKGLSEWELSEHSGLSDQELSRLKNNTAQGVFYIVIGSALPLLLIVGILGANVFHFW